MELSIRRREEMERPEVAEKLLARMMENTAESTVLVNHARSATYDKMMETGICYMRAGNSKGSLLVRPGFERLAYVCLHTNGENIHLYPLTRKGFQIWTPEALREIGFDPQHAPYYAVLHFDPQKKSF